ncbi:peptidoglycan-binding domain-containing protein [Nocardiopsis sp. SBT366]|uniref:peptidoglycan-binding domain-containing protein n=1 Tax=Nocardiopsis sp. SBT366 TaxID=1580529 RepID=UPI00066B331C|nr:peptidoglycan-binding domain-containing protein [Nocardiopsis sp. SBT366]
MSKIVLTGVVRRIASLATAGAIALGGMALMAPTAAADDYERTPNEVIQLIEAAQIWPNYSLRNPGPSADILAAQYFLNHLGYITDNPSETFTREFDRVLRDFERREGIAVNGVLESESWIKIRNELFPTSADSFHRDDRGFGVRGVQVLLNAKYNAGLNVNGTYNSATERAVRNAQRDLCIGVDGAFGRLTYRAVITGVDSCRAVSAEADQEAPAQEAPAQEAPAQEAPAEQGPAEQAPVEQAPVEDAPVEGDQTREMQTVR